MHPREQHIKIGTYIRDIVFAASDGIVTTFAVVAGVAGAQLSPAVVLIIGVGNILADGFSMATGNYLGIRSEQELYEREERLEREEIKKLPEKEKQEVREILSSKGFKDKKLEHIVTLITENKKYWIEFMMHEEMGLVEPSMESPFRKSLATLISFIGAGSIPLLVYILNHHENRFLVASLATASALFTIGALRSLFSPKHWLPLGLEMLCIGGSAAVMAYIVGLLLKYLVQ